MKRLLSISGGGIFGLLPALVLKEIEARTGKPCASLFDMIAGTSTGGIIACGLANGVPAAQLADLYLNRGGEIFGASIGREVENLDGVTGPKYSAAPLEAILKETLGQSTLIDAKTKLLVPASRTDSAPNAFWFRSWKGNNFPLWQVARATSAAPVYFPCFTAASLDDCSYTFVDGGLTANNPAEQSYIEASALWPNERIVILSLGTGKSPSIVPVKEDWGLADWANYLASFVLQCQENGVDQRLTARGVDVDVVNPPLGGAMDDVSHANLSAIQKAADSVIASKQFADLIVGLTSGAP